MNIADAKAEAFAMPLTSLFYSPGPYRFINREFLIITNRTDMDVRRTVAPVAKLPVHEVLFVVNMLTDLTLGLGEVVHDHLNPKE